MSLCPKCEVELGNAEICPLCRTPVAPGSKHQVSHDGQTPGVDVNTDRTTLRSAKLWLFEVISLISFTAAIVVFAADFAFGFAVTWSVFPLAAIIFVWLFASAIIGLIRVPIGLVVAETVIVVGFLLALSHIAGGEQWFLSLALPTAALAGVTTGLIVLVSRVTRASALQTVGVSILGSGFFLVGLELIINTHLGRETPVSWSLVTFACAVSLFFLMLFINKRLRERHSEFRRIFHI